VKYLFLTILAVCGPSAFALPADSDQPIQISADAGTVNESEGISTYSGNVTIDQGSMHISADEVEVIAVDSEVIQIIARTSKDSTRLARYKHQPANTDTPVLAEARLITYMVQEERLHLSGQAVLKQMRDSFSGDLLFYDVNRGIVDLKSGSAAGDRIKMIINPKQK
jgi:lipopolysaccharide export system protein LptA